MNSGNEIMADQWNMKIIRWENMYAELYNDGNRNCRYSEFLAQAKTKRNTYNKNDPDYMDWDNDIKMLRHGRRQLARTDHDVRTFHPELPAVETTTSDPTLVASQQGDAFPEAEAPASDAEGTLELVLFQGGGVPSDTLERVAQFTPERTSEHLQDDDDSGDQGMVFHS
ncbi:MAG: hypothetical protein Q9227_007648 [Pyrenula ochraceoflavens]